MPIPFAPIPRSWPLLALFTLSTLPLSAEDNSFKFTSSLIDSFAPKGKDDAWPHLGTLHEWNIEVDTYNNAVKSNEIGLLYLATCRKLEASYGKQLKTYFGQDEEGYPSQVSIVQFFGGQQNAYYLMVGVFNGNDADVFTFTSMTGTFDPGKRQRRDSFAIPDDVLRKDKPSK